MAPQRPKPIPAPPSDAPSPTHTTARDREMGRDAPPSGDLGHGERSWSPPPGQQGISNRPDDGASTDTTAPEEGQTTLSDPPESGVPSQQGLRGHAQDERPNDEK